MLRTAELTMLQKSQQQQLEYLCRILLLQNL